MEFRTSEEDETKFINWGIELIRKELKLSKKMATMEMNWFILQWGLTTTVSDQIKQKTIESKKKKA